jgi:hypothetical protein
MHYRYLDLDLDSMYLIHISIIFDSNIFVSANRRMNIQNKEKCTNTKIDFGKYVYSELFV